MRPYLDHLRYILTDKDTVHKPNRTGVDTLSNFGYQTRYSLDQGFPLMTTKRVAFKGVAAELLWFLSGDTNIRSLVLQEVPIWNRNAYEHWLKKQDPVNRPETYSPDWTRGLDEFIGEIRGSEEFAQNNGDLGDVYGAQWRHWKTRSGEIDQLKQLIDALKTNPNSRRHILTAWNPEQVPTMALPPCHMLTQFNVAKGKLDCQLTQRSCDMFLGVPYNIASYALLTHLLAQETGLQPGRFVHTLNDAHIYCGRGERGAFYQENLSELQDHVKSATSPTELQKVIDWIEEKAPQERIGEQTLDHIPAVLTQLMREPRPLPKLILPKKPLEQIVTLDITLEAYNPHKSIAAAMAV